MTREEFIFTKKFPGRLYRHIIFWLAYYLFSLLTYFHDSLEKIGFRKWILLEASEDFLHVITQMLFCYAILYFLLPRFFDRKKYFSFIAGMIVLGIAVFWLYYFEHIFLFKKIHTLAGLPFRPPQIVYWFVLISLLTYFPVSAGLTIAIKVLKNFYIKQRENQLLIRENANAELQLLKAQIHPHFLFNTLNNIYSFSLGNSAEASQLVEKLSATIHYMITDCNSQFVELEKELKMLKDYIDLEKVRYGDRLELWVDLPKDQQDKMVAPLLMVPFVENCFKHGTSMMRGKQWIRLSIHVHENTLDFNLTNSKPLQPAMTKNKNGIGLANVKKRLSLLYPGKHQLSISATEGVFSVQMQIEL